MSIGYKANIVPGTEPWFDSDRGVLKNAHGLVDSKRDNLGGLYVTGWLKRGPSGIIGTNIIDAKDTVATIMNDVESNIRQHSNSDRGTTTLNSLLQQRGVQYIEWEGYKRIVDVEKVIRRSDKQPREKLTNVTEMLRAAGSK